MKRVHTESRYQAAEGAERTRTAVRAPGTSYTYERRGKTLHGVGLFLLVCTLAVLPYAFPSLGIWALLGLLVLLPLTKARATAEDVTPDRERGA